MDIKPPIYHKLVKEKDNQIDRWLLDELKDDLTAPAADSA